MDSNNFLSGAGAGEREARIFSPLVARRHFHLAHGVGRSGDVAAVQPKAAGSSLMVQVANALAKDVLRLAGMRAVQAALVLPVATGMSLMLVLLQLRESKPNARYVIWLESTKILWVFENGLGGDAALMDQYGVIAFGCDEHHELLCTEAYDSVKEIAELCQERVLFYPGRASATPTLDFFITMLQMGKSGYRRLLQERKQLAAYMREKLDAFAIEEGERVLHVSSNEMSSRLFLIVLPTSQISFALTLGVSARK
ncbi:O-phosphoseryl-tRNA(Sec) selenium transferase [Phytophthora cactorum]|nr:O-phosphoseryl-tRNA(Sec) selenium transferase [Phytophthora cactorum]